MVSTFPAIFSSADLIVGNHFPAFDGGFTPWDYQEIFPSSSPIQSPKPVTSDSGSGHDIRTFSGSGSDDPNRNDRRYDKKGTCPDKPNHSVRPVSVVDERKRRRMISNRESARRSRMRKQKHLENLRNQVNRLRVENRELSNRLRFVSYHFQKVRTENAHLQSEYTLLRQKLSDIRQILLFRQLQQQFPSAWPCNTLIPEQTPSLIT
ncbi:hypothetical protein UlMin_038995 [Ulmus minor]